MAYTGGGRGSGMGNGSYGGGRSASETGAGQTGGLGGFGGGESNALSDPRVSRFTERQQRGFLGSNLGFGMMGAAAKDLGAYYRQKDYEDLQAKIRRDAKQRLASEALDRATLATKDAFSRIMGTKAAYRGDLPELEGFLGGPSAMRGTHNTGGLFGNMFGSKGDDVETSFETRDKLGAVDPNNPMGTSALGYGLGIAVPGAAQFVANYTQSPYAGFGVLGAGKLTKGKMSYTPKGYTALNLAGGLLGVPGLSQATGILGLASRAADLNYAGYTGSPNAPDDHVNKDNDWWWLNTDTA